MINELHAVTDLDHKEEWKISRELFSGSFDAQNVVARNNVNAKNAKAIKIKLVDCFQRIKELRILQSDLEVSVNYQLGKMFGLNEKSIINLIESYGNSDVKNRITSLASISEKLDSIEVEESELDYYVDLDEIAA